MRFLIIVPGSRESEAGQMPSTELIAEMTAYNEALVKAGVMLAGEGLHPTSKVKKATFAGGVEIQIRPIFEAEDFGRELTPELRDREAKLRHEVEAGRQ